MTPAAKTSGPKIIPAMMFPAAPAEMPSGQDHYREDAGEDTEDQHELVALFRGEGDESTARYHRYGGWSVMRRG
jgi:hypothetical protein